MGSSILWTTVDNIISQSIEAMDLIYGQVGDCEIHRIKVVGT